MEYDAAVKKADEMVMFMSKFDINIQHMWDDLRKVFIDAPASTKKQYHHCYTGGLVVHSVEVTVSLIKAFENYFNCRVDDETKASLAKVGLFHDLGKIGDLDNPFYLAQHSDWHRQKLGQLYIQNDAIVLKNHAQGSIFLLQSFEVKLDINEFQAILGHDGQYIDDNKSMKNNECWLTLLLHQADMLNVTQHNK